MIQPRETLKNIVPYKPGKSIQQVQSELGLSRVIKLASNENPWGSPVSVDEMADIIASVAMYPDIGSGPLLGKLAHRLGVSESHLMLGNGSDEILTMIGLAYLNPGDRVLTAKETFSEYGFVAHLMNAQLEEIALKDYTFDLDAMAVAINASSKRPVKMVFIANPNNPTGTIVKSSDVRRFMTAIPSDVLVVMDEAYGEFVEDPDYPNSIALLTEYPNLIVTRTFSKLYGLAGFRIGYAIASPEIIDVLYKVRQPFNINSLALAAATVALDKTEFVSLTLANNWSERDRLITAFLGHGLTVIPTQANFVCLSIGDAAPLIVRKLLERGIIVRHLASFGMPGHVRITIGTPEQNTLLIAALADSLI
jgi:histidinol-phosphate aminotransferase